MIRHCQTELKRGVVAQELQSVFTASRNILGNQIAALKGRELLADFGGIIDPTRGILDVAPKALQPGFRDSSHHTLGVNFRQCLGSSVGHQHVEVHAEQIVFPPPQPLRIFPPFFLEAFQLVGCSGTYKRSPSVRRSLRPTCAERRFFQWALRGWCTGIYLPQIRHSGGHQHSALSQKITTRSCFRHWTVSPFQRTAVPLSRSAQAAVSESNCDNRENQKNHARDSV